MAHQSYAKTVLTTALDIAGSGSASCGDISSALFVQTRAQHKRLLNTLSELYRTGKLHRVGQGLYAAPIGGIGNPPSKWQRMWNLIRMRKRVSVEDLVELGEVSHAYALECLQILVRRGYARKIQEPGHKGIWVVVNDTVEAPENEDKAARLRELRRKKKKAITGKLDEIDNAVQSVRSILQTMEDE